jgi:transposase-like protein
MECAAPSSYIGELRKERRYYLAFLNYPESIRRSLSTTNVVEAMNGQLEIMRRNSGKGEAHVSIEQPAFKDR